SVALSFSRLKVGFEGQTGSEFPLQTPPVLTLLYGPAVRCKLNLQSGSDWSCPSVSGPRVEQIAPGHHGYPPASDLILGSALEGQLGQQITNATARPFSISSNPTRRPRWVSLQLSGLRTN